VGGRRHNEERHGGWHLEVEDDRRKLGRWTKLLTGPMKKMVESMRWARKIGEGILVGQYRKEKKEIETGKDFLAAKDLKFDSNCFLFTNSSKHMHVILFCSSRRVEHNGENKI
jgi:hypothetical protein